MKFEVEGRRVTITGTDDELLELRNLIDNLLRSFGTTGVGNNIPLPTNQYKADTEGNMVYVYRVADAEKAPEPAVNWCGTKV